MKKCIICSDLFHPKNSAHKTCSKECRKIMNKKREKVSRQRPEYKAKAIKYQKRPEVKERRRARSKKGGKKIKIPNRNCKICNHVFSPNNWKQITCSEKCMKARTKALRQTPEYKTKIKARQQMPKNIAKRKARDLKKNFKMQH